MTEVTAMEGEVAPGIRRISQGVSNFYLVEDGGKLVLVQEVSTFGDEETVDVPGRPRVVHLPGHTPGMSALLFEGRRVVMTGDALVMRNPLTGRLGPQIAPAALNLDSRQALSSLDALGGAPADLVLPGHGEPGAQGVAEALRPARSARPAPE